MMPMVELTVSSQPRRNPRGAGPSPPPPTAPEAVDTEVEDSSLLDGTHVFSDGLVAPTAPYRRRLLLSLAAGAVCAVAAIITISVVIPSHGSQAAASTIQEAPATPEAAGSPGVPVTPAAPVQQAAPVFRGAPIRRWSVRTPGWALRMYDVPVPSVQKPPYSSKAGRAFKIEADRFWRDGSVLQIAAGDLHYFRIHPAYWRDRLLRIKAMGLNTIQVYVPWNFHVPRRGDFRFQGFADVESFLAMAQEAGLLVLLRPGPYICGEWDFGGLPWWLANKMMTGGKGVDLSLWSVADPMFLELAGLWWNQLLPRVKPYMYENGGPVAMVQISNEYGMCGSDPAYLQRLAAMVKEGLGNNTIVYTTDPPWMLNHGSLRGAEVYTVVDFGADQDINRAFYQQKLHNAPGMSPPFCSEFYTGWIVHWGEKMVNTDAAALIANTARLLAYGGGSGSLSLYVAHGGTNFGFWAGANNDSSRGYLPHITSYDYGAPLSESGLATPKFTGLRGVLGKELKVQLPPVPAALQAAAHGTVLLTEAVTLLESVAHLAPHGIVQSAAPQPMEEYFIGSGMVLYRTKLPAGWSATNATLQLGAPVHDYAKVFVDGLLVAELDRNERPTTAQLQHSAAPPGNLEPVLDILVSAMGRLNFGCGWDVKGLTSPWVTLAGVELTGWEVHALPLEDLGSLVYGAVEAILAGRDPEAAVIQQQKPVRRLRSAGDTALRRTALTVSDQPLNAGPVFFRGNLSIPFDAELTSMHHPFDTFLSMHGGWSKGIAWVNGFNLGWYWPSKGPQVTLFVPGPLLRRGDNDIVLLEMDRAPDAPSVTFVNTADFKGPGTDESWTYIP